MGYKSRHRALNGSSLKNEVKLYRWQTVLSTEGWPDHPQNLHRSEVVTWGNVKKRKWFEAQLKFFI